MARKPEATAILPPAEQDVLVAVVDLRFDRENPRMPNVLLEDDEATVRHLLDDFDVEELVQSILASGWIDYEPLIVQRGTNVVFEGNRRLAALRLIGDTAFRERVGYSLPTVDDAKPPPERVRARYVADRKDARRFIAFKHINAPTSGTRSRRQSTRPSGWPRARTSTSSAGCLATTTTPSGGL
jgi:hypothetical protein